MDFHDLSSVAINLFGALVLGGLIGFERQWHQRQAGLRTNTLVALGAATFVIFAGLFPGEASPTRIAAQVVSGIGFLGAGIIFKEGMNVRGLNTAATLWCSAAIGVLCGAGYIFHATIAAFFIIGVNGLLRPLVRLIECQAISNTDITNSYSISLVCYSEAEAHVRALLLRDLGQNIHIQELESTDIEDTNRVEVNALVRAEDKQDRLVEQVIGRLSLEPMVTSVRWRSVTEHED